MLDKNKAEMEKLNNQTALQVRVKNEADMLNNSVRDFVERHPDGENIKKLGETPLVGRRREYVGRYDKTELLKQEIKEKASFRYDEIERDFEDESEYESIQIADPDTGEIIESKIKKITI